MKMSSWETSFLIITASGIPSADPGLLILMVTLGNKVGSAEDVFGSHNVTIINTNQLFISSDKGMLCRMDLSMCSLYWMGGIHSVWYPSLWYPFQVVYL